MLEATGDLDAVLIVTVQKLAGYGSLLTTACIRPLLPLETPRVCCTGIECPWFGEKTAIDPLVLGERGAIAFW